MIILPLQLRNHFQGSSKKLTLNRSETLKPSEVFRTADYCEQLKQSVMECAHFCIINRLHKNKFVWTFLNRVYGQLTWGKRWSKLSPARVPTARATNIAKIFLYIFFPRNGIVATPIKDVRLMIVTAAKP